MTTKAIMIAEIESDTERSDTTAIGKKIDAAIRHYQPRRLFFNESRSITFSTVASTDTYRFGAGLEITTEFYRIDGAWITIAAEDVRELTRRNYTDLEGTADNNTDEGEPSDYAFINEAIRLWRNPDAIYSVRLMGHIKVAAPASDAETGNAWMVEGYDLIMSRAKAELYAHRWEDPGNAQLMRVAEMDALSRLQSASMDMVENGYLESTEF
jgi:hypothetical protein